MSATPRLPRVLFCVDAPMWAHDFKTMGIIKNLSGHFDFRKCYHTELTDDDFQWADVILIYYWKQMGVLHPFGKWFRQKITIGGISCPTDLEGEAYDIGMKVLNIFDVIFVHNQFLYDDYKTKFAKPFYFNPNGVDTNFYTPAEMRPSDTPLVVGWAGSLTNHGNNKRGYHDIIVPAVEQTPGVVLRTAAREDKWRGPDEMLEFYRGLDVYLVASRIEGTPNPGLESAACGIPVISTRVGNMPELIRDGENGFLIDRTPQAMSARLAQLCDNPALRRSMQTQIRQDILGWDWSVRARAYKLMLEESLTRRGWDGFALKER